LKNIEKPREYAPGSLIFTQTAIRCFYSRSYLFLKRTSNIMKKYSILLAALLATTAVTACEKKAQKAAAPMAPATAPTAPATSEAPKPADAAAPGAAAPVAPEKK
jgi:hypothetical protein